jgi:tetratricopeptide (TPR) repeat protein
MASRSADRVRVDRKALRRPDEFHTLTAQVTGWVGQNRRLAAAIGAGVLAVAVLGLVVGWYSQRRSEAAAIRFQAAHNEFDAGKFTAAAETFASLHQDYGSTPFGRLATLYQAHALARAGDAAGAATAYREYLASSPPTAYLKQSALVGVGRAQEALGDRTAALDAYQQAAAIDGPLSVEARLGLARVQEANGDLQAAQATYAALADDEAIQLDTELLRFVQSKLPAGAGSAPQAGAGGS